MKWSRITPLFFFLFVLLRTTSAQQWVGTVAGDSLYYTKIRLVDSIYKFHVPQRGIVWQNVSVTEKSERRLSFLIPGGGRLELFRSGSDELNGRFTSKEKQFDAMLRPYTPVRPEEAALLSGNYTTETGRVLGVQRNADGIEMIDYSTGEVNTYWRSADSKSFFRVLPLGVEKKASSIVFDGSKITVSTGKESLVATRIEGQKSEEHTILNGDVKIAGTLAMPSGNRAPLVIVVPGSGPGDRTHYPHIRNFLLSQNIAVFSYDKRGCGASTGNLYSASFTDFATDVVKAVDFFSKHPNIDEKRIFIWGHSQGGWLAPMVANISKRVRGVVTVAGPVDDAGRQTLWYVKRYLETSRYASHDVRDALTWMKLVVRVLDQRGTGYDTIESKVDAIKTERWASAVTIPSSKENLLSWQGYYHDPMKELKGLSQPLLAFFGGNDINVDGRSNAERMRSINKKFNVVYYPKGDHEMLLGPTGNYSNDWPYQTGYPKDYFQRLGSWISGQQ